jgi:hypothetical protein
MGKQKANLLEPPMDIKPAIEVRIVTVIATSSRVVERSG